MKTAWAKAFVVMALVGGALWCHAPSGNAQQPLGAKNAASAVRNVKTFGARGDGRTDDTGAIQKAIDATQIGEILEFPAGTYMVTTVGLKAGVHYRGINAVIKRPPNQGKWVRTFDMARAGKPYEYSADVDSPLMIVEGFTFDGNRAQQGEYNKFQLEQAHLLMLYADPAKKGRLRVEVRNCQFRNTVADGISVYTNADVRVLNCSSYQCFRGGFVLTGGNTRAFVSNFSSSGTVESRGMDIEVDGEGYGKSKKVELTMEKLRFADGYFDVGVSDGSQVHIRDVMSAFGIHLSAPDSRVLIENAELGVGRRSEYWNRLVFPGDTTFRNCRFIVRPEPFLRTLEQSKDEWAAVHVYWNVTGTAYKAQKLRFERCDFLVSKEVPAAHKTYAFLVERFSPLDTDNRLELDRCTIAQDYDYGLWMHSTPSMSIGNTRIAAARQFVLGDKE